MKAGDLVKIKYVKGFGLIIKKDKKIPRTLGLGWTYCVLFFRHKHSAMVTYEWECDMELLHEAG